MKILYLVPYVPSLIRVRSFNFIRSLAGHGHEITLLTLWNNSQEREELEALENYCEKVIAFELPHWRSFYNCLVTLPTSTPLQAVYCWQPKLAQKLRELTLGATPDKQFDVIHIEHLRGAKYGVWLRSKAPKQPKAGENFLPPMVWDSVDSISHLFRQAASSSKSGLSRTITSFDLPRTENYEGWLASQFEDMLVTSHVDKKAFQSLMSDPARGEAIKVVPNGADLAYFRPDETVLRQADTLVVSGKMSYHANVNMVMYLAHEILPLIWAHRPGVKLWVVGKDPTSEILALGEHPNIEVTGYVDSLLPYLREASVAVAPILYGAGIQLKVLEAMACGTPVVSTPQAISVIAAEPGKDVLVGGTPEAFAQAVLDLLNDTNFRDQIGQAGRLFVERNHNWDTISLDLENIYRGVIEKHAA